MTGTITRITEVANEEIEYRIKISKMSPSKIFMFLITPPPPPFPSGNAKIQKTNSKHIFECFEKRKGEDGKK